jgi:hypothetical protein
VKECLKLARSFYTDSVLESPECTGRMSWKKSYLSVA